MNSLIAEASTLTIPLAEPTEHDLRVHASGFRSVVGLRVIEWSEGRCVVEIAVLPHLTNFTGVVHGAVVTAAVDMAATLAGCYTAPPESIRKAVTLSLTCAFVGSVREGFIRAVATRKGGGKKIYTCSVDVTSAAGDIIATGQATLRHITEH